MKKNAILPDDELSGDEILLRCRRNKNGDYVCKIIGSNKLGNIQPQ
ncbi:MAG TPA: hypothetical protein VMC42_04670 [Methanoregulaceae archaeon]|nr:hypothetical protein [Methanoregulaceae archaeon]